MPIAYESQWPAVAAQTMTSNATAGGLVTIANTDGFYVLQDVTLKGTAKPTAQYRVLEVISSTQLYVGLLNQGVLQYQRYRANAADVSAYTTAASSTIEAAQQNQRKVQPGNATVTAFEGEPIKALRNVLVDDRGQYQFKIGALQSLRAAAILTNSYVATSALDISSANQVVVQVSLTKGSLTNAILKFEWSDDTTTWAPFCIDNTASGAVSSDEFQSQTYTDAKILIPATASATLYSFFVPVKGRWFRAQILGTGTLTSSTATIKAYAGIS